MRNMKEAAGFVFGSRQYYNRTAGKNGQEITGSKCKGNNGEKAGNVGRKSGTDGKR